MTDTGPFQCQLCGEVKPICCHLSTLLEVCCKCGERIANHWWQKHSGEWLTYPSEPRVPRGFQKQPIPEEMRWSVFERDGFKCLVCGSQRMLRADHVIAESKGGPATLENLQTLCRNCNSKKGTT